MQNKYENAFVFFRGETQQQPSDYINVMDIFMMAIPFILLLVDRILGDQSCLIGNKDTGFTLVSSMSDSGGEVTG